MAHAKLALSFIETKPFAITKWSWLGSTLFIVSLALLAYVFFAYQQHMQTIHQLNSALNLELLKATKKQVANVLPKDEDAEKLVSQDEVKQINETVNELIVHWDILFKTIEQTLIADVALLEISPNSKKRAITIRGEAKNLKAVFAYIKTLDDTSILTKVHLDTHSVGEESSGRPVSFTLTAEWLLGEQK